MYVSVFSVYTKSENAPFSQTALYPWPPDHYLAAPWVSGASSSSFPWIHFWGPQVSVLRLPFHCTLNSLDQSYPFSILSRLMTLRLKSLGPSSSLELLPYNQLPTQNPHRGSGILTQAASIQNWTLNSHTSVSLKLFPTSVNGPSCHQKWD